MKTHVINKKTQLKVMAPFESRTDILNIVTENYSEVSLEIVSKNSSKVCLTQFFTWKMRGCLGYDYFWLKMRGCLGRTGSAANLSDHAQIYINIVSSVVYLTYLGYIEWNGEEERNFSLGIRCRVAHFVTDV
jgi:predicted membrane channel-forming protein YqfA (hemolysin III family)